MSRLYEIQVNVTGYRRSKAKAIRGIFSTESVFDDGAVDEFRIQGQANEMLAIFQTQLAISQSEEGYARDLARSVYVANGKACDLRITLTYLEDLPYEVFEFGQGDFDDLVRVGSLAA